MNEAIRILGSMMISGCGNEVAILFCCITIVIIYIISYFKKKLEENNTSDAGKRNHDLDVLRENNRHKERIFELSNDCSSSKTKRK